MTPWTERLYTDAILQEYPRPQLQRRDYTNLNGMWEYQITKRDEQPSATEWQPICVPFALGTPLSQTDELLSPSQLLWYRKKFSYKPRFKNTLLNFEAVDQCCDVYVNNVYVGSHQGGYTPFSFDISQIVAADNEMVVCCYDDSDQGNFIYGKQRLHYGGIWHMPTAGIWQTVWLESVTEHYVKDIKITPYYDQKQVYVHLEGNIEQAVLTIIDDGVVIAKVISTDNTFLYTFDDFHPWTPDDPHLYDVLIETEDDAISSYFGMRKFSQGKDRKGHVRFMLNNKPIFLSGILDQGYNSDGYLTPVSDESMIYELTKVKDMGFNMIRKHVKVEPARWYRHCDELGILVFQDIPNGGQLSRKTPRKMKKRFGFGHRDDNYHELGRRDDDGRVNFVIELDEIISSLYNAVSICTWVVFNEGWGQFDSRKLVKRIRIMDNSRLVDHASGWIDQGISNYCSVHSFSKKYRFHNDRTDRIQLLSAFGGHIYCEGKRQHVNRMGFKKYDDKLKWIASIEDLYLDEIVPSIEQGLSGCIYMQLSDVEDEKNGLFTFDRQILKMDVNRMRIINEKLKKTVKK